jgi:hypothetical protein
MKYFSYLESKDLNRVKKKPSVVEKDYNGKMNLEEFAA